MIPDASSRKISPIFIRLAYSLGLSLTIGRVGRVSPPGDYEDCGFHNVAEV